MKLDLHTLTLALRFVLLAGLTAVLRQLLTWLETKRQAAQLALH